MNIDNTGKTKKKLGFGTYNLSQDRGVPYKDAQDLLKYALNRGITFFDTAPLYGAGYVEYLLGDTFVDNDVHIINKVGRFEDLAYRKLGKNSYTDKNIIRTQFEYSLRLLKLNKLDTLLIHEADWKVWWDNGLEDSTIIEVLKDLKEEGKVDKIGISMRDPYLAKKLCSTGIFNTILFVHYYNVLWQESIEIFVEVAIQNNMTIAIGTPFKQGLLIGNKDLDDTNNLFDLYKDLTPNLLERLKKLYEISSKYEISVAELSLRFLLSNPDVDIVFAGSKNKEELDMNLAWEEKGPLSFEILSDLKKLTKIKLEKGYSYEKI